MIHKVPGGIYGWWSMSWSDSLEDDRIVGSYYRNCGTTTETTVLVIMKDYGELSRDIVRSPVAKVSCNGSKVILRSISFYRRFLFETTWQEDPKAGIISMKIINLVGVPENRYCPRNIRLIYLRNTPLSICTSSKNNDHKLGTSMTVHQVRERVNGNHILPVSSITMVVSLVISIGYQFIRW